MQTFQIHNSRRLEETGDLFGIFFEDINHAADGGLYAELIQNRAFEFDPIDNQKYHALYAWEKAEGKSAGTDGQSVTLEIRTESPFTEKNPHYLRMSCTAAGTGVVNTGYNGGILLKQGETYRFSCYARAVSGAASGFRVCLMSRRGKIYAWQRIIPDQEGWKQYCCELIMEAKDDWKGRLAVLLDEPGCMELDFISLFPKHTYKDRPNGLRRDLGRMLEAMRPKFIRFPGGCLVHDGSLDDQARDSMYRWKNTIGPVEQRPARRNNWGYNQTLGLGFYEYFQLAEDLGAEPLPVLPAAYDPHHQRKVPLDELQPWIDDALDLIEFANGAADTKWGAVRAQMGHPEPFGLKYLAIGNEEVGEGFTERYPYFHKAIRERYPDIMLIGSASPFAAGGEYERGWSSARACGCDLIDEHYYMNTDWMLANTDRYDSFSADDPKVFLGEYASWGNSWKNAVIEAAFMTGLERNVRAVGLACYAPLFANVDYVNWRPDMIWFDNHRAYGTANYYVQSLFMRYQGTHRLGMDIQEPSEERKKREQAAERCRRRAKTISGELRVRGNDGEAVFSCIEVINRKTGEKLTLKDCSCRAPKAGRDAWEDALSAGVIPADWTAYTLTLRAKELSGYKGFSVYVGEQKDHILWTLGGWQNLDICLEHFKKGKGACLTEAMFSAEQEHEYELELSVDGRHMRAFVDGQCMLETEDRIPAAEPLYVSAVLDERTGDIIMKAVNVTKNAVTAVFELEDFTGIHTISTETMAYAPGAKNSMKEPEKVVPVCSTETMEGSRLVRSFAPYSLTVLCIRQS